LLFPMRNFTGVHNILIAESAAWRVPATKRCQDCEVMGL
jgi:hypothetical protein